MKNIFYLFIVLICIGCEDPEPLRGGIETAVNGRIYDYSNALPLAGQKVVIKEYMKTQNVGAISPNFDFKGNIDSTYTDAEGNFNFTFKTTGKGNNYRVTYESTEDVYINSDFFEIDKPGQAVALPNLSGIQLYPLSLKIIPNNLSAFPINITTLSPIKPYVFEDITQNTAVARQLYVDKNSKTQLRFVFWESGNEKHYNAELPATGSAIPAEQTIELNATDFVD